MGEIKRIKGKLLFKHETAADWELSSYIPEAGEKVLYDPDEWYNYTRVKYGDGTHRVHELSFSDSQADWEEEEITAPGYIKNKPEIPSIEGLATEEYVDDAIEDIPLASNGAKGMIQSSVEVANISEYAPAPVVEGVPYYHDTTYGKATNEQLGLVRGGFEKKDNDHPVELDSEGRMYVNVPNPQVQADYNTNEPNDVSYIKNRPFYKSISHGLELSYEQGNIISSDDTIEVSLVSNFPLTIEELTDTTNPMYVDLKATNALIKQTTQKTAEAEHIEEDHYGNLTLWYPYYVGGDVQGIWVLASVKDYENYIELPINCNGVFLTEVRNNEMTFRVDKLYRPTVEVKTIDNEFIDLASHPYVKATEEVVNTIKEDVKILDNKVDGLEIPEYVECHREYHAENYPLHTLHSEQGGSPHNWYSLELVSERIVNINNWKDYSFEVEEELNNAEPPRTDHYSITKNKLSVYTIEGGIKITNTRNTSCAAIFVINNYQQFNSQYNANLPSNGLYLSSHGSDVMAADNQMTSNYTRVVGIKITTSEKVIDNNQIALSSHEEFRMVVDKLPTKNDLQPYITKVQAQEQYVRNNSYGDESKRGLVAINPQGGATWQDGLLTFLPTWEDDYSYGGSAKFARVGDAKYMAKYGLVQASAPNSLTLNDGEKNAIRDWINAAGTTNKVRFYEAGTEGHIAHDTITYSSVVYYLHFATGEEFDFNYLKGYSVSYTDNDSYPVPPVITSSTISLDGADVSTLSGAKKIAVLYNKVAVFVVEDYTFFNRAYRSNLAQNGVYLAEFIQDSHNQEGQQVTNSCKVHSITHTFTQKVIENKYLDLEKNETVQVIQDTVDALVDAIDTNNEAIESLVEEVADLKEKPAGSSIDMENGTGDIAVQQLPDGVADGIDFRGQNNNASSYDTSLDGVLPYGATGKASAAFGGKSMAMGKRAFAEGTTTIAKGDYSHAEGSNSVALGTSAHVEGVQNLARGQGSHAEGENSMAHGRASHAEGYFNEVDGQGAHVEGGNNYVKGMFGHAEGYKNKVYGIDAHAEGAQNTVYGDYAHVEGYNNTVGYERTNTSEDSGNYSHVSGRNNTATGRNTLVHGDYNIVSGDGSVVFGWGNQVSDRDCFVYGDSNKVLSADNYVVGSGNTASEGYGFLFGHGLLNTRNDKFSTGYYNLDRYNALFEVGNGTSTNRRNAFEVYADGRASVQKAPFYTTDVVRLEELRKVLPWERNGEQYSRPATPKEGAFLRYKSGEPVWDVLDKAEEGSY